MAEKRKHKQPKQSHSGIKEVQLKVLERKIDNLGNLIHSHQMAYEAYIQMLSSMVGHDMKNCLVTIDGLLYNKKNGREWTADDMLALEHSLNMMHDSIKQFQDVSMVSDTTRFEPKKLVSAIQSIHRNTFQKEKIAFAVLMTDEDVVVEQPYHTIQIIINNLIINSIKALSDVEEKKIGLKVYIKDDSCHFIISDNGIEIEDGLKDKIFKYGFSTTGGSGIGLFQVKECLKQMQGGIEVVKEPSDSQYVKSFAVHFPLKSNATI